jgi:Tfp pilus assembly protein PilE
MIVVAIIGVLASIAIPKFSDLINRSKDSAVRGALASLRSAINIYYADTDGLFPGAGPSDLKDSLTPGGRYLNFMPKVTIPAGGHLLGEGVELGVVNDATVNANGRVWAYFYSGPKPGHVTVNCTHLDKGGQVWSSW